jgi:hypothetical protein
MLRAVFHLALRQTEGLITQHADPWFSLAAVALNPCPHVPPCQEQRARELSDHGSRCEIVRKSSSKSCGL